MEDTETFLYSFSYTHFYFVLEFVHFGLRLLIGLAYNHFIYPLRQPLSLISWSNLITKSEEGQAASFICLSILVLCTNRVA